jgi:hypothetical protein
MRALLLQVSMEFKFNFTDVNQLLLNYTMMTVVLGEGMCDKTNSGTRLPHKGTLLRIHATHKLCNIINITDAYRNSFVWQVAEAVFVECRAQGLQESVPISSQHVHVHVHAHTSLCII